MIASKKAAKIAYISQKNRIVKSPYLRSLFHPTLIMVWAVRIWSKEDRESKTRKPNDWFKWSTSQLNGVRVKWSHSDHPDGSFTPRRMSGGNIFSIKIICSRSSAPKSALYTNKFHHNASQHNDMTVAILSLNRITDSTEFNERRSSREKSQSSF